MPFITTPHQAELNAASKMRDWGFTDAAATTGGADGGVDVRSSRALAQVKWRGGVVGRPDIQRLYGAREGDGSKALFFFSASGYSKEAVDYAERTGVGLYLYDPLGAVTQVAGPRAMPAAVVQPVIDWAAVRFWSALGAGLVAAIALLCLTALSSGIVLDGHQ